MDFSTGVRRCRARSWWFRPAHRRRRHRGSGRSAGGALPCEPDVNLRFGLLTIFGTRTAKFCPKTHRCCNSREQASSSSTKSTARRSLFLPTARRMTQSRCHRATRAFLLVSPPQNVESAGTTLDGVRAQARKARSAECAASRNGNAFSLVVGDVASLSVVKYVISLDTDTQLPRDAARQFIARWRIR